jgi:SAM-dependent methyltransferase
MIGAALKQLWVGTARYLRFHTSKLDLHENAGASARSRPATPLRLDLGCGSAKRDGFLGVDRRSFDGVDGVSDLTQSRWLFNKPTLGGHYLAPASLDGKRGFLLPDNSVSEVHCSHFLEHLEHNQRMPERVRFMNELWRVMVPGGRVTIITPHWASQRAYGDFTHADKPVSEMFYLYLDKDWRAMNAPDNDIRYNPDGYFCDFTSQIGHTIHPDLQDKTDEEKNNAIKWFKESAFDLHATLKTRKAATAAESDLIDIG